MSYKAKRFKEGFLRYLRKDFEEHHLSYNLVRTMEIVDNGDYEQIIKIPAREYNMPLYMRKGIFMYDGNKSYATELNEEGSKIEFVETRSQNRLKKRTKYIGNHKGYIEKSFEAGAREIKGKIDYGNYKQ